MRVQLVGEVAVRGGCELWKTVRCSTDRTRRLALFVIEVRLAALLARFTNVWRFDGVDVEEGARFCRRMATAPWSASYGIYSVSNEPLTWWFRAYR